MYPGVLKFILIGDAGSGKSSTLARFTKGDFDHEVIPTLGVEYGSKNIVVDGNAVKVQIWDTAGLERYRSIVKAYYRGSVVALAMFDITNPTSFKNLPEWIEEFQKHNSRHSSVLAIVGNKSDLASAREVSEQEASNLAKAYKAPYFEVSCRTGEGVRELFEDTVRLAFGKIDDGLIRLSNDEYLNRDAKKCCA